MKKNQTIDLPVLPLRGLMIFPNMVLHFDVGRKKSVTALEQGMTDRQKVFLISQKDDDMEDPGFGDLCRTGTIAEIRQVMNLPGENIRILTLKELRDEPVDMFSTVFIGNSQTRVVNGRMVTPRGYDHA